MTLKKTIYKDKIVFNIEQALVDDVLAQKIIENIDENKLNGIDMQNVSSINSPLFIKFLLENKIKLFNLQSEVLAYLAITLKDGALRSYINFSDFLNNKRELIKRRFLVA